MMKAASFSILFTALAAAQPEPTPQPKPGTMPTFLRPREVDMDSLQLKLGRLQHLDQMGKARTMVDHAFQFQFQQSRSRGDEQADRQYERGQRAMDKRDWAGAVDNFGEAAASGKGRADGALYWKAYALIRLGRGQEAASILDELAQSHPQSRWLNDAKALRLEIAQAAGRPVSPEDSSDDELKIMAINGLMQSDSERSIPLLEKILLNQSSPKLRERALFVLSQSESPKAREVVARVAKGGSNPDLQMIAVRSLGVYGSKENRQILADVYSASTDPAVKKQILNSYMVSGERERLFAIAKSDPVLEMRKHAVRYLGVMGANAQLESMYAAESSAEIRSQIMQAMFVGGNTRKLIEIAKTEKEPALRERAIRHLGTMNNAEAADALVAIYAAAGGDTELRKKILQSLFVQGNVKHLVEVARKESNPELRRAAVQHLSLMKNKEATDFLMELLNK